jgi:hypothetical protein
MHQLCKPRDNLIELMFFTLNFDKQRSSHNITFVIICQFYAACFLQLLMSLMKLMSQFPLHNLLRTRPG